MTEVYVVFGLYKDPDGNPDQDVRGIYSTYDKAEEKLCRDLKETSEYIYALRIYKLPIDIDINIDIYDKEYLCERFK